MMRLYINVDHVATLRQARRTDEPDPVRAAVLCELGGADGITVHLREDRRHVQERDVRLLLETVRTGVNLELAAAGDVMAIALELRPMAITLVPERREEITTEGGLELNDTQHADRTRNAVEAFRTAKIRTSLFIDPDPATIRAAAALQVEAIELHTGKFAGAWARRTDPSHGPAGLAAELERIRRCAVLARSLGLDVHAGHGLTYENVFLVARIPEIEELNIGHSIVSRAIFVGIQQAVAEMKQIITNAGQQRDQSTET